MCSLAVHLLRQRRAAAASAGQRRCRPTTGHVTELFDDVIEPEAVGYQRSLRQRDSPKHDALLRERTQTGDAVVRARVVTVTSGPESHGAGWRIGLRTLETLAGKRPPQGDFTFVVDGNAPAAGIVRMLEARLIGTTFVVFVRDVRSRRRGRRCGGGAGAAELHFHFAKDDKDELGAVREASLLARGRALSAARLRAVAIGATKASRRRASRSGVSTPGETRGDRDQEPPRNRADAHRLPARRGDARPRRREDPRRDDDRATSTASSTRTPSARARGRRRSTTRASPRASARASTTSSATASRTARSSRTATSSTST